MGYINFSKEKGSALILSIIMGMVIISFAGSAIYMSASDYRYSTQQVGKMKAMYIAESGLARGVQYMNANFANNVLTLAVIDELADQNLFTEEAFYAPYNGSTVKLGEYTVTVRRLTSDDFEVPEGKDITGDKPTSVRYVSLVAIGYIPDAKNPKHQVTITSTYEMSTQVSHVFDYSYFVNNWGWLYGSSITTYGNVRANGNFSLQGPVINGKDRFERVEGNNLINRLDDNANGKADDGGIYAWNVITGSPSSSSKQAVKYEGKKGVNTQPSIPQEPMPNLTNLAFYEAKAKSLDEPSKAGSIKINGVTICDGVLGDNETKQNLYLEGTQAAPIEVTGTVVVRGDVILRGWIKGKGVIYAGRNVYVPQRLLYVNPPNELRPTLNTETSRENRRDLWDKQECDLVGLFARENILLGDISNSTWQSKTKQYIDDTSVINGVKNDNTGSEDVGIDRIPATGDAGEKDGVWTVEYDPSGNPIPGTGEDIDGDGAYDPGISGSNMMTIFGLKDALSTANWENLPSGVTLFKNLSYWNESTDDPWPCTNTTSSSSKVTHWPQIDGVLYTNHFVAGYVANSSYTYKNGKKQNGVTNEISFNGSVISRNESINFSTGKLYICHDERLTGEDGTRFNMVFPRVWNPMTHISTTIE